LTRLRREGWNVRFMAVGMGGGLRPKTAFPRKGQRS
jgi:hypothetical protein